MNIGIDIDGVLTNIEQFIMDYGTKYCIEENIPINISEGHYDENQTFNWTNEQTEKFWNTYLVKYFKESRLREFAKEIIDKLQQEGDNIFIITARNEYGMPPEYYGKTQEITKQWLDKNNIQYNQLIFARNEEKLPQCIENKIDIMIEDSPKNILNISSKIKVIKYDCQYNKTIDGKNITKAYSWYHIYNIIKKMKGE